MLAQGNYDNALEIAQRSYEREKARSGDKSLNTAVSRGYYAVTLARKGRTAEALQAFKDRFRSFKRHPAAAMTTQDPQLPPERAVRVS
jgi:hypothetical protein